MEKKLNEQIRAMAERLIPKIDYGDCKPHLKKIEHEVNFRNDFARASAIQVANVIFEKLDWDDLDMAAYMAYIFEHTVTAEQARQLKEYLKNNIILNPTP